jgi:transcriptional regulator with XRE-family HTH domain
MTEPTWNEEHGKELRTRRQQRGFTQESLAEAAGVSLNTIKNLEHGARQPRPSTLQLIAEALGCALDDVQEGRRVPSIAVLPFKNLSGDEELGAIGEALGVRHVLEGSVPRSGDQLRITAQLIQVDDGFHIWSERFDR